METAKTDRQIKKEKAMEGNQMKMREAVVQALRKLQELCVASCEDEDIRDDCERLLRSALSAPARQCDVGTPEEQKARMLEYNVDGIIICERCPHHGPNWTWCALRWAQTPYDAKEGGAE